MLKNKTVFITGGTRGIGRAIALKLAENGANIVLAARTKESHDSPGTLDSVSMEVEKAGGHALGVEVDVRFDNHIQEAVEKTIDTFGGIDILIHNAGATYLTNTPQTPMNTFDHMMGVNGRAAFAMVQACLPSLKQSDNPHILMIAPPLSLDPKWLINHGAYTLSKYAMSLCVLGMAQEFKAHSIAVNGLWPKTAIATETVSRIGGQKLMNASRQPTIMADAAFCILQEKSDVSGQFFIDEDVVIKAGFDLNKYVKEPGTPLTKNLFID